MRLSAAGRQPYRKEGGVDSAAIYEGPVGALKKANQPQVRIQKELQPWMYAGRKDGRIRYDFGRNFAGRIKIKAAGERGSRLLLRRASCFLGTKALTRSLQGIPIIMSIPSPGKGKKPGCHVLPITASGMP